MAFAKKSVRGRCCPSSLYTCPPDLRPEGLARDCHLKGSPDFEQFYISGFPESTQFSFKSVASTSFATPAYVEFIGFALHLTKKIFAGRSQALRPVPLEGSFLLGRSFMRGAILDLRTLMAAASRLVLICEA